MIDSQNKNNIRISLVLSLIMFAGVYWSFYTAKQQTGKIILPGGITYLGPSPTTTMWNTYRGKIYPYAFSHPSSLSLGFFPNDPTDAVTQFIDHTNSQDNLFFRVETLSGSPKDHIRDWHKKYKWGVVDLTEFTNSVGLKGYRATTPYDHVFFEIPNDDDHIIWISGKLFEKEVFDKLVDSVEWKK